MIHLLDSGTDVAFHVVYDPEAAKHIKREDIEEHGEQFFLDEAAKGNLLHYSVASDGGTLYRVYIDERIPDELRNRAFTAKKDLLLKVPSGTLIASGGEYLCDEHAIAKASTYVPNDYRLATRATIPPGNYLVDAYELQWNQVTEIKPVLRQELGMSDFWSSVCGPAMGCGFVASVIGLVAFLGSLMMHGWSPDLMYWIGTPFCILAVSSLLYKLLVPKDYWKRRREIEARFPPNVLDFRRLPADADLTTYKGGEFGTPGN